MKKQYSRFSSESEFGTGITYLESTDGIITRQVELYGERWFWGDFDHNEYLTDQPAQALELDDKNLIEEAEFERVWDEAHSKSPQGSPRRSSAD